MFSHKSKCFSKTLNIYHIYFFCVFTAFMLCFALNARTIRCNIAISTPRHCASLQICEVRHCWLCLTLAKQILINELKACLFFSDKLRTTHIRDGNSVAYAAARCCRCTARRSVATKICVTSQRQPSAAYYNFTHFFTIIANELCLMSNNG